MSYPAPFRAPPPHIAAKPQLGSSGSNFTSAEYVRAQSISPAGGDAQMMSSGRANKRDEFFRNTTSDLNGAAGGTTQQQQQPQPQHSVANGSAFSASIASNGSGGAAAAGVLPPKTKPTPRQIDTYVGFDNIPNQIHRRAKKHGFEFNLMVVGQGGLGKSTFVNSLFLAEVYKPVAPRLSTPTVHVEERHLQLVEDNVTLNLSLIDTPGFGDAIDNSKCWEPLLSYIERKFNDYFVEENKVRREASPGDPRVHACLYFIPATGHGIKPLDLHCMKLLSERVNVVPVISKADTLTVAELANFKRIVHKEIDEKGIKIYKFPDPLDADRAKEQAKLKERVPFAVVGGSELRPSSGEAGGKAARCRTYLWGTVEVDNLQHNDFIALRDMLIRTHLIDMVDVTRGVHYENFRCRQMLAPQQQPQQQQQGVARAAGRNPLAALDDERNEHERAMAAEKARMENILSSKLREREDAMKRRETDLQRRQAELESQVTARRQELDQKRLLLKSLKEQHPQIAATVSATALNGNVNDGSPCSEGGKSADKVKRGKTGTLSGVFNRH